MKLDNATILKLAEHLENAELQAHDVTKITNDYPDMDWDDAYAIQDEIRRRKEARGNKIAGLKCGLTSFAKMKQMGVETPVFGFVADYMSRPDGGEIKHSELIHPKVEAEICIVTKAPLKGPGCHVGAVMAAVDFVLPAVEIIDSRYRDFKFDLKSVIADNTSSSRFVIGGNMRKLDELDRYLVMMKNMRSAMPSGSQPPVRILVTLAANMGHSMAASPTKRAPVAHIGQCHPTRVRSTRSAEVRTKSVVTARP